MLRKVLEFCNHHVDAPLPKIDKPLKSGELSECGVPEWDCSYVNVEQELLFELILAANFLDIRDLLDLTCAKVASMIKGAFGVWVVVDVLIDPVSFILVCVVHSCVACCFAGKTPEEIRKTFNIVNDFTPEEEAQVREENRWCEEA